MQKPKTLEERRLENSIQYKRERQKQYSRKNRAKKVVQQLLETKTG
jgi:hypothetical protein